MDGVVCFDCSSKLHEKILKAFAYSTLFYFVYFNLVQFRAVIIELHLDLCKWPCKAPLDLGVKLPAVYLTPNMVAPSQQAKSTDRDKLTANKLTANQWFHYIDFITVILPQSEGLVKMALGIVKIYLGLPFSANRHCSRSVCSRSVCCGQLSWTHFTMCLLLNKQRSCDH